MGLATMLHDRGHDGQIVLMVVVELLRLGLYLHIHTTIIMLDLKSLLWALFFSMQFSSLLLIRHVIINPNSYKPIGQCKLKVKQ